MKSILANNPIGRERREWLLSIPESAYHALTTLAERGHLINAEAGWWSDVRTGGPKDRNFGELIALAHSELSESMEGHRKALMDDHLPQYPMWQVEMADAIIRIFDMCGAGGVDIGRIIWDKMAYNARRADHKMENRAKVDGKKY